MGIMYGNQFRLHSLCLVCDSKSERDLFVNALKIITTCPYLNSTKAMVRRYLIQKWDTCMRKHFRDITNQESFKLKDMSQMQQKPIGNDNNSYGNNNILYKSINVY